MTFKLFKERRQKLLELVKKNNPEVKNGAILLMADFESYSAVFRQESSFYYFTGLSQPACALLIGLDGKETLYIPHYGQQRDQWVSSPINADQKTAHMYEVDEIAVWGEVTQGYTFPLLFSADQSKLLSGKLKEILKNAGSVFCLNSPEPHATVQQKIALGRLGNFAGFVTDDLTDISPLIAAMRRIKSKYEIELLYKAVELTIIAQEGAACALREGIKEYELQAGIEYIFRESGAYPAFPAVVASGRNGTILHHTPSAQFIKNNELVVVDIGAEVQHYCADITRTYPASGVFTKRQRELYSIVLAAQEYIAQRAAPGYWLNNNKYPEKSLNHLVRAFLAKHKCEEYLVHSIGHFLGLDVHDVGDVNEPLQEGDVITIEPGLYIPAEGIGIRIEDDYWIVKDGVVCLSHDLAKEPDDIEEMAQSQLDDEDEDDSGDEDDFQ